MIVRSDAPALPERTYAWVIRIWAEAELLSEGRFVGTFTAARAERETRDDMVQQVTDRDIRSELQLALRDDGADVYWNDRAPAGWCEVQIDDGIKRLAAGDAAEPTDIDAAYAVCDAAGVPRTCAVWARVGDDDSVLVRTERDRPKGPGWFAAVPAPVAYLAGLIDDEQLALAMAGDS